MLRLDRTSQALSLPLPEEQRILRVRARGGVRKLGRARGVSPWAPAAIDDGETLPGLVLGDGRRRWVARPVARANGEGLLLFEGDMPPAGRDLRVLQGIDAPRRGTESRATICFTPGTLIDTPDGPRAVESLEPGDRVHTRDDGAQPILWTGLRHVTGARMFAFPELRPVRIRAGALGGGAPRPDLVVSPDHRVLLRGPKCRALWGEDEVLVRARDLRDDRAVLLDHGATEATYVHLMLARHQILRANGVDTESFHPGEAELAHLDPMERADLLSVAPGADRDPAAYGPPARRCLSRAEHAILRHEAPAHLC
ncbi:Hint domain-containing protein [Jannaschia sp. W003]|uniref:Hint domain-containing protein n=1 Tax=Jannaschia sp. W003 TaxID=2867012 RepID=UPI0021A3B0A2|nr:Hint domain-containing protein [Jannaschia sp. W003]UWQ22906.1 Hint domain-containing protein [Jannaschia sp. W003]